MIRGHFRAFSRRSGIFRKKLPAKRFKIPIGPSIEHVQCCTLCDSVIFGRTLINYQIDKLTDFIRRQICAHKPIVDIR